MAQADLTGADAHPHVENPATPAQPPQLEQGVRYALLMLMLAYMLNFIDRTIIGSLAEPIKADLHLSDTQVGMMGGLAFAIFYCTLGLPIARLAETRNRVAIISTAITVWSVMTAVCGMAQNFAQLFLARLGVGVGEAGCTPPAHSLIADYFPPERRATAYGIYSLGIPLGTLFGAIAGGWIAHHFGWRRAFLVVGLPGLVLAVVMWLTVREPPRRQVRADGAAPPPMAAVVAHFWQTTRLRLVAIAMSLVAFTSFAIAVFAIPFLLRGTDLNLFEAAFAYGIVFGLASFGGTSLGGVLVDRLAARRQTDRLILPGIMLLIASPLYVLLLYAPSLGLMAVVSVVATAMRDMHIGPSLGAVQNGFPGWMRARASALLLLLMNLVGLGLGPLLIGWISDRLASRTFIGDFAACSATADLTAGALAACRAASFGGLQLALAVASIFYLVAGILLLLAARYPQHDITKESV